MSTGALEIIKFTGYKDNKFNNKIGDYTALVNPENYSISYGINVNEKGAQGSSLPTYGFNKGNCQTLNFKILFDGSGVINNSGILGAFGNSPDVTTDIATFKSVVYNYQSDTHQPPFIKIQWGPLSYNCMLSRMTISFKLFKPDGTPLRAEADCSFYGSVDEQTLALFENPQSPDLTHTRIVKAGDTLALLCFREYGDSKYYYQVAKFNGLTDIKELTPGMKLLFPPVTTK